MDLNGLCPTSCRNFVKRVLTGHDDIFGPFISRILGIPWVPGRGHTVGLWDDRRGPIAGCLFESSNGASILVHIAAGHRPGWATREFLWFCSYYPFIQLGVRKVLAPVESTNSRSIRWTEKFGFSLEATLKDCAPNGDLLIFSLRHEDCRWLKLGNSYRGQTTPTN